MKKKIIFISIFTLIIIVIGSIIIYQMNKKEIENIEQDITEELKENENINDVSNLEQEESTEESEIVDNTAKIQEEIASNEVVKVQKQKENVTISENANVNAQTTNAITIPNKQVIAETSKQIQQKTETVEQKQEEKSIITENNKTTATTTKKEEFKANNEMAQKMINIINSNKSEYMKQYGYSVVIDSSIVNQTSQFTFTEQRVKDKIIYKFGTIRVYARDYFVNGQYVWTECYII